MSEPKLRFEDYESTAQWMVAVTLDGRISDYDLDLPMPTPKEIADAIDGAMTGGPLYASIGAAWEAAADIVYDMFPKFRDPSDLEDTSGG